MCSDLYCYLLLISKFRSMLLRVSCRLLLACLPLSLIFMALVTVPTFAESATPNTIGIEVTTHLGDHQKFNQGDTIAFLVSLDKDAHILMIYQDAENNLIQIIPNRYRQQEQYRAGLFIAVPDSKEPFEFKVQPPFGEEKLWVFASNYKFPDLDGHELSNGLRKLNGNLKNILKAVRPAGVDALYGESTTSVITEP
jgi:hypothetical protein